AKVTVFSYKRFLPTAPESLPPCPASIAIIYLAIAGCKTEQIRTKLSSNRLTICFIKILTSFVKYVHLLSLSPLFQHSDQQRYKSTLVANQVAANSQQLSEAIRSDRLLMG